jgi:hypothetical protein
MGSVESLGTLARACLDSNLHVQQIARESFRELLKRLRPEHYALLNDEMIADLLWLLSQPGLEFLGVSAELSVLEIIGSVEWRGDARSIQYLRRIAGEGKVSRWKAEAQRVLNALQTRQQGAVIPPD